eukprot:763109-Hanusia_phi.AAC.2
MEGKGSQRDRVTEKQRNRQIYLPASLLGTLAYFHRYTHTSRYSQEDIPVGRETDRQTVRQKKSYKGGSDGYWESQKEILKGRPDRHTDKSADIAREIDTGVKRHQRNLERWHCPGTEIYRDSETRRKRQGREEKARQKHEIKNKKDRHRFSKRNLPRENHAS